MYYSVLKLTTPNISWGLPGFHFTLVKYSGKVTLLIWLTVSSPKTISVEKKRKKFKLCPEIEYGIWSKEDTLFKLALNYDIIHIICIYVRDAGCMGNKIAFYVKKESLFFVDTTITSF